MAWQQSKEPDYYRLDRAELYAFARASGLKIGGRVLNVGCAAGVDSEHLRRLGAETIHGIEPVEEAASLARDSYDSVFVGGLDDWTWDGQPYDLIVVADVLEHMVDPFAALSSMRKCLSEQGRLLVSIPNVRHLSVVWTLVARGDWRYEKSGIMDDTHLRFFTRRSFVRLLHSVGYDVVALQRWGQLRLSRALSRFIPGSGEFLLSQILILAGPSIRHAR